jgi:HrpA-like RNA helicase
MGSPVFEIYGRTFPVQEYFLEDIVQMLDFVPMLKKKRIEKMLFDIERSNSVRLAHVVQN